MVVTEDRRVYVRMHGPEYLSDEEMLRRAIIRKEELERTVRESELSVSELERERNGARDSSCPPTAYEREAVVSGQPHGRRRPPHSNLPPTSTAVFVAIAQPAPTARERR